MLWMNTWALGVADEIPKHRMWIEGDSSVVIEALLQDTHPNSHLLSATLPGHQGATQPYGKWASGLACQEGNWSA